MATPLPENPYLAARREWNERYGSYIDAARSWQFAAFGALAIAIVAVGGVTYIGAQNRVVPYVVELNAQGDPIKVTRINQAGPNDPRVVKASLARFVHNWRTVTADFAVTRTNITELYSMLSAGDPATQAMNEYMKSNTPMQRAGTETVSVEITNIVPVSGVTWQVDWAETRRNRSGQMISVDHWRASPTLAFRPPTTETDIMRNPIGVYIRELAWSQQIDSAK